MCVYQGTTYTWFATHGERRWEFECACKPGWRCTAGCESPYTGHTCEQTKSPTASPAVPPTTTPTTVAPTTAPNTTTTPPDGTDTPPDGIDTPPDPTTAPTSTATTLDPCTEYHAGSSEDGEYCVCKAGHQVHKDCGGCDFRNKFPVSMLGKETYTCVPDPCTEHHASTGTSGEYCVCEAGYQMSGDCGGCDFRNKFAISMLGRASYNCVPDPCTPHHAAGSDDGEYCECEAGYEMSGDCGGCDSQNKFAASFLGRKAYTCVPVSAPAPTPLPTATTPAPVAGRPEAQADPCRQHHARRDHGKNLGRNPPGGYSIQGRFMYILQ